MKQKLPARSFASETEKVISIRIDGIIQLYSESGQNLTRKSQHSHTWQLEQLFWILPLIQAQTTLEHYTLLQLRKTCIQINTLKDTKIQLRKQITLSLEKESIQNNNYLNEVTGNDKAMQ